MNRRDMCKSLITGTAALAFAKAASVVAEEKTGGAGSKPKH